MECNGQSVDRVLYPELYSLMANTPNYQGVFLRGYGNVSSNHFGSIIHQSDELGQLQGDTIRNITGSAGDFAPRGFHGSGAFRYEQLWIGSHRDNSGSSLRISFDASRVVPTANENRPINRAVKYLIKAK